MLKIEFEQWLQSENVSSIKTYFSKIAMVEKYMGNIDEHYDYDRCNSILNQLTYSMETASLELMPEHGIPIKPGISKNKYESYYEGTRDYKSRVTRYTKFRDSQAISQDVFPDSAETEECSEGARISVFVNKYERSAVARQKCIGVRGCRCSVCDLDFQEMYGEVGNSFIHVHHIIPLNKINQKYTVNPLEDLIPVCPNCHAMLHRKVDGKYLTVDELKRLVMSNKK